MYGEVRSIYQLTHEEIVLLARAQAGLGEPCRHRFEPGSSQAISFELAYQARIRELDSLEAV